MYEATSFRFTSLDEVQVEAAKFDVETGYAEPVDLTALKLGLHDKSGRNQRNSAVVFCLAAYVILAASVFWPVLPWDTTHLPSAPLDNYGTGDPAQMTWFLEWVPYALRHGLNLFHTNFIDYPHGVNLANNTLTPLLGFMAIPVTLTLGPVAAFNILLRLAFASSAGSMFLVLRTWCRWPAAFIGGLFYGFGPYMASHGETHLNLVFVPIPPLIVWCLFDLFVTQRRRPVRMGVLLGVLAGAQALIDPELLVMLAIVVAIGAIGVAIGVRSKVRQKVAHLARAIVPAVVTFVGITGYMAWSILFGPGHVVGSVLPVLELQQYRADLLGPILPAYQWIAPTVLQVRAFGFVGGNITENSSYLGLFAVALIVYFAIKWRRDRIVLVAALLALVAFVLSLGSSLVVNNHATGIPLPEALFAHVPLLNDFLPARFSFVVALFAAIALAVGGEHSFQVLATQKSRHWRAQVGEITLVVATLGAVILVVPVVPFRTHEPFWPSDTMTVLKTIPSGSVVLTYPSPTGGVDDEAMAWQAASGMRFRLIGGYATVQGGVNYAVQYPPLLKPRFVQEFLFAAEGPAWYPTYPTPSTTLNATRALCTFISNYHVGAVVYLDAGRQSNKAKRLFLRSLGQPANETHDHKLLVWLTKDTHC